MPVLARRFLAIRRLLNLRSMKSKLEQTRRGWERVQKVEPTRTLSPRPASSESEPGLQAQKRAGTNVDAIEIAAAGGGALEVFELEDVASRNVRRHLVRPLEWRALRGMLFPGVLICIGFRAT